MYRKTSLLLATDPLDLLSVSHTSIIPHNDFSFNGIYYNSQLIEALD